ncbi:hypothetical protein Q0812_10760 [Brevundimonas sp. 2R-24]|uniref:Flagellar protein FlaG n=1 Tax=Peiella sedimenti TaxID=3061083 RepID=A0ABT8SMV6_9CAUL|nr:hypothetical protein [Caulobacteraceae bacterium XZ-24]
MKTNVGSISAVEFDAAISPTTSSGRSSLSDRRGQAQAEADRLARYKLIIEQGPGGHGYVYKTLDRTTGEVVSQFPREELLRLQDSPDYSSGSVIDTSA